MGHSTMQYWNRKSPIVNNIGTEVSYKNEMGENVNDCAGMEMPKTVPSLTVIITITITLEVLRNCAL